MTVPERPKSLESLESLEELIAGSVLENLSHEESEELRQLLQEYPEFRTEVYHLQEVLGLIPYGLPEVTTPQHLREAILQAANAQVKSKLASNRSAFIGRKIAGSIAALLVLVLGLDDYLTRQHLSIMQAQVARQMDVIAMLQSPKTHLVSLKGMDMASAASGSIIMTPGEPKAVLILQNLPVLPQGQSYQLWSVVGGEKIPSGQFNASSQGTVFVKLSTPPSGKATALVVTIETSPTPNTPDGPMVMTSSS